ncbi:MAG: hypothetical protein OWU33_09470 [Firmicutes bacterium]|nr:hypothetical protein [Bacillota bacterium]
MISTLRHPPTPSPIALVLTGADASNDTHGYGFDRHAGTLHRVQQSEAEALAVAEVL